MYIINLKQERLLTHASTMYQFKIHAALSQTDLGERNKKNIPCHYQ